MTVKITGGYTPRPAYVADNLKNEFMAEQDQDTFVLTFVPVLTKLVVYVNGTAWYSTRYSNPAGNTILLDTRLNEFDYVIFKQ